MARCLHEAQAVGAIARDASPDALAQVFWIGWEGAVMRARLCQSTAPLDQYWEFFAHSMTTKTPAQDGVSADNPFRRGILCHESISSGPDRQPHRRRHQRRSTCPPLPKATFGSLSTGRVSTIKMPWRSPAKAKSSVSSRWCRHRFCGTGE